MSVSTDKAGKVLALCARHCCICRRFRPTQLQVHHILEQSEGGSDQLDNLIAICVSCHSDVHTNTKLTRRFSIKELRLHRDGVYKLVAAGKLPAAESGSEDLIALSAALIKSLQDGKYASEQADFPLPLQSLDILLSAVSQRVPINIDRSEHGTAVRVGSSHYIQSSRRTASAVYPDPIIKLVTAKLVNGSADVLYVTQAGEVFADDVLSANPSYTMVKAKCMVCSLHFVVCTWEHERHSSSTLHCPECGNHGGRFLVWYQRMFGFIFQTVPGAGQEVAGTSIDLKRKKSDA